MSEDPTTAALREMVRVNRDFIRKEAIANGDTATVAEMDAADAREQEYLRATPEAKAHAYIRSLERSVEEARNQRDALAARLDQYRAWLVEMLVELSEAQQRASDLQAPEMASQWLRDRKVTAACLSKLDEITGKGASDA